MLRLFFVSFLFLISSLVHSQALNGVYSVGNDASDDFSSLELAITDLTTNGVDGPVTFGIRPGTYTVEQLKIPVINGSSATNTIRFEALNSSAPVILQSTTYVMQIEKSDYFSFDGLTFEILEDRGQSVGLHIKGSSHINITNCTFTATFLGSYYPQDRESFIYLEGQSVYDHPSNTYTYYPTNHILIENNIFHGGNGAIFSRGLGVNRSENLTILNNIFEEKSGNDIRIQYTDHVSIKNNIMTGERLDESLEFRYIENDFEFSHNRQDIDALITTPLFILDCPMDPAAPMIIKNNFFSANRYNSIIRSSNINFWNNSFFNSSNFNTIRLEQNLKNIAFNNNIISGGSTSLLYFSAETDFTEFDIDYNCYHNNQDASKFALGSTNYDLEDWNSTHGLDSHSILVQPNFTSTGDLHLNNDVLINGMGKVLSGVITDIDGDIRDTSAPDIGADEFDLDHSTLRDIEFGSITYPGNNPCALLDPIKILVQNNSTFPITSFDVEWWLNGTSKGKKTFNETIEANSTKIVTLERFPFAPNTTYNLKFKLTQPNAAIDNNLSNNDYSVDYKHFESLQIYKKKDTYCDGVYTLFIKKQPGSTITWSTGDSGNYISATSGSYAVTVASATGCSLTSSIDLD